MLKIFLLLLSFNLGIMSTILNERVHECYGQNVELTFYESNDPSLKLKDPYGMGWDIDSTHVKIAEEIHGTGAMMQVWGKEISIFMHFERNNQNDVPKFNYTTTLTLRYENNDEITAPVNCVSKIAK